MVIPLGTISKYLLLVMVLFMTIAVNLPDNMISRLGFEPDYMLAALAAIVITGLTAFRRLAAISLVVLVSLGANMPEGFLLPIDVDRDILTACLMVIVFTPVISKHLL